MHNNHSFTSANAKVLIVEHSSAVLHSMINGLETAGYQVTLEQYTKNLLPRAILFNPDLIILATILSEQDSFETCRLLKQHTDFKDTPIIFMLDSSNVEHKTSLFQAGGADYLCKPIVYEELVAKLSTHLQLNSLQRDLQRLTAENQQLLVNQQIMAEQVALYISELRTSEYEFRILVENAPDNIVRYDMQCRKRYINPALENTLGITSKQAKGKRPIDLFPQIEAMHAYQQQLEQVIRTGESVEFELANVAFKDSAPLYHWIRMAPELDEHGQVVGAIAIGRDFTEQKRLYQELSVISNCNQTLLRAETEQNLLNDICRIVCEQAGYDLAWVGY
jgi:PAS domain S-box-containing protein